MRTRISCNPFTLLATWQSQVGYSEYPFGSNMTKYGAWYGMNGVPWCAIGDSCIAAMSGNPLPAIRTTKGYAYVPDLVAYAQATGQWKPRSSGYTPKGGDQIVFQFGNRPDHVGRVKAPLGGGRVHTFECNTNAAGSRTGGSVLEKIRSSNILGFVAVDYNLPQGNPPINLRRIAAAKLRTDFGKCPNMGWGHPGCCEVVALEESLNLIANGTVVPVNGIYEGPTRDAVAHFQEFMNRLGANIQDVEGFCGDGTRWWVNVCLENIRDGKTP